MKRFSNASRVVLLMAVMLLISLTANASARAGTASVYAGSTTSIELASAYQRTLKNATSVTYRWYSGDTSYATVSSYTKYGATIKGVKSTGTSTVKVYFYASYFIDGYYRTMDFYYEVTVVANTVYVTSVTLNKSSETLTVGETLQLSATVYPTTATDRSVTWSTNNSTVASVSSSGLVTAKSAGTATITCKANDGSLKYATCQITVEESIVSVTKISLNRSSDTLIVGETSQLSATVYPTTATDRSVTWSTNNSTVASVSSSGLVTAKSAGTATIKCKANDGSGKYATCKVVVKESEKITDSDEVPNALTIYTKDGSSVAYIVGEYPLLSYSNSDLIVKSNGIDVSYPIADILKLSYEKVDVSSSINAILTDETAISYDGGAIVLSGLSGNSLLQVYTIGGVLVHSEKISASTYTYPLFDLSAGIYVINVNGKTFKISKK